MNGPASKDETLGRWSSTKSMTASVLCASCVLHTEPRTILKTRGHAAKDNASSVCCWDSLCLCAHGIEPSDSSLKKTWPMEVLFMPPWTKSMAEASAMPLIWKYSLPQYAVLWLKAGSIFNLKPRNISSQLVPSLTFPSSLERPSLACFQDQLAPVPKTPTHLYAGRMQVWELSALARTRRQTAYFLRVFSSSTRRKHVCLFIRSAFLTGQRKEAGLQELQREILWLSAPSSFSRSNLKLGVSAALAVHARPWFGVPRASPSPDLAHSALQPAIFACNALALRLVGRDKAGFMVSIGSRVYWRHWCFIFGMAPLIEEMSWSSWTGREGCVRPGSSASGWLWV